MNFANVFEIFSQYKWIYLNGLITTIYICIKLCWGIDWLLVGIIRTIPISDKRNFGTMLLHQCPLNVYVEFLEPRQWWCRSMVVYYGWRVFWFAFDRNCSSTFYSQSIQAACMSEIVRGGILSIDKGQFEAARAIGMNHFQTMRTVCSTSAGYQKYYSMTGRVHRQFKGHFSTKCNRWANSTILHQRPMRYFQDFWGLFHINCALLIMTLGITAILRNWKETIGDKNYNLIANQMQKHKLW